jgi:hypothetical protein
VGGFACCKQLPAPAICWRGAAARPTFVAVTELHLRPRTVSELVDAAFALYRRDSLQYIMVAAVGNAPLLILQLLVPQATTVAVTGTPESALAASMSVFLLSIASWITYALMSAVVVRLGSRIYLGEKPDLGKTIAEVVPRLPALMLAALMKGFLAVIGVFFFLVGVLYVVARYFAVSTTIVLENQGPLAAFSRSSELSKGRKRHILNTLLLVYLIYFVLSIGVTLFAQLASSHIIQTVVTALFTMIVYPVIALTEMMLYYDARIRGEGFDLEQMAASLDAGRPPIGTGEVPA